MNTKTDEISSGLVAVTWIAPDLDRFRVRICEEMPTDAPLWSPMCWISDAEAIASLSSAVKAPSTLKKPESISAWMEENREQAAAELVTGLPRTGD